MGEDETTGRRAGGPVGSSAGGPAGGTAGGPGHPVARWMLAVAARPRATLAALGVLVLLSVWAATGLSVDTDSSRMLSPDLPFQERAQEINAAFPETKNAVVVAVRGRADAADTAVAALVEAIRGSQGVESVFAPSADPFFATHGLLYLDRAALEARLTRLSKSANLLARLRSEQSLPGFLRALDEAGRLAERAGETGALDPLYAEAAAVVRASAEGRTRAFGWTGALAGEGGEVLRVISVQPSLDFARLDPAKAATAAIERAVAGLDPLVAAPVEIGLTGDPVLRADELRSVASRIGLSLALSLALVALVLWLALGTAARAGLALGALAVTLVLTTGLAAATVGALNLISIAFVVLMTGLGIDFAIHVMAHLDEDARERPGLAALGMTGQALGPALLLTAASTAAAFLAFAGTDFLGMAQLGLIGAFGVLVAFAVAVTLIPAAVALRPGLARGTARVSPPSLGPALAAAGLGWAVPAAALALGLAATAVGTGLVGQGARFDADPMGLRNPDARSVQVHQWLVEDPDVAPLRLALIADDAEAAASAAERLAAVPEVRRATWLGALVPADQDDKLALVDLTWPSLDFAVNGTPVDLDLEREVSLADLADRLAERPGPGADLAEALTAYAGTRNAATDEALAGLLFRHFPLLLDRLRAQLAVDRVAVADLPGPLVARYRSQDGRYRVEIVPAADLGVPANRRAFVAAVTAAAPQAGGAPAQIEGAADTVAAAMLQAALVALAATGLLSWIVLRRAALVAAILVPVALAGAVTLAASVVLGLPFNYANVIVLPLLIGIGVDSGIHLALRTARRGDVFATATPGAVFWSALTTIGAFATLGLSEHRGTASMGIMLAIALVAAVAMAFALTPALVRAATRSDPPQESPG